MLPRSLDMLLNFLYFTDQVSDLGLFFIVYWINMFTFYTSPKKKREFMLVFLNGKMMLWSCSNPTACARHSWRKRNRLAHISIHWRCQYVLLNEKAGEIWRSLTSNSQYRRHWSINHPFTSVSPRQRLDSICDYPTQSIAKQLWGVFKKAALTASSEKKGDPLNSLVSLSYKQEHEQQLLQIIRFWRGGSRLPRQTLFQ